MVRRKKITHILLLKIWIASISIYTYIQKKIYIYLEREVGCSQLNLPCSLFKKYAQICSNIANSSHSQGLSQLTYEIQSVDGWCCRKFAQMLKKFTQMEVILQFKYQVTFYRYIELHYWLHGEGRLLWKIWPFIMPRSCSLPTSYPQETFYYATLPSHISPSFAPADEHISNKTYGCDHILFLFSNISGAKES